MDPEKGGTVRSNQALETTARASYESLANDDWGRKSLSGHERDRFFLSREGRQFADLSLLSGADHPGDGRSCAFFDYNRDGRLDIAVANTNQPSLTLFRNDLASAGTVIAVKLRGGTGVNADAIGARVTVETLRRSVIRELHCGEGNAAQNSKILLFATTEAPARGVTIRWPGGRETKIPGPVAPGTLITAAPDAPPVFSRWKAAEAP